MEPATTWAVPLPGLVASPFGWRWGRQHAGIDISANLHTDVRAARPGTVVRLGWLRGYEGYGLVVVVEVGGGIQTLYAHLAAAKVRRGQAIAVRDLVGRAGCTGSCTGPHLHFEVRVHGSPVNPLRFYDRAARRHLLLGR
jgi:murein DD-endopeptidase MepM/ murein hydrolase activator NlpD